MTTPLEAERAAMVVSRFQAKAALQQAGLLEAIEALIAASPDPMHRIAWVEAQEFRRTSPMINMLAASVGLTETDLDVLFRTARTIEA